MLVFGESSVAWTDFTKQGSDYISANGVQLSNDNIADMNIDITSGEECMVFSDQTLKAVDCFQEAKYLCSKSSRHAEKFRNLYFHKFLLACPSGYFLFEGQNCLKVVLDAKSNDDAKLACSTSHPRARLYEPRNKGSQEQLEKILQMHGITSGVHLGLNYVDTWTWNSDKSNIFQYCENMLSSQISV